MRTRGRWARVASAALLAGVSTAGLAGTASAAPGGDYVPANKRVAQVAAQYWAEHPNDYAGLGRTIRAHGGDSVRFMVQGHGMSSPAETQRLYNKAVADSDTSDVHTSDVPNNAFTVTGSWYHVQDQYGEWWNANGYWDFRDDFIGTGDPGDVTAISADVSNCWVNDGSWVFANDYQGNPYNGSIIRQGSGVNESVYDVDDATSGFKMLTDNGAHTLSFKRSSYGCGTPLQARYYYEHNQGGGSGWTFTLSLGGLAVSYGTPTDALQKATPVFRT